MAVDFARLPEPLKRTSHNSARSTHAPAGFLSGFPRGRGADSDFAASGPVRQVARPVVPISQLTTNCAHHLLDSRVISWTPASSLSLMAARSLPAIRKRAVFR